MTAKKIEIPVKDSHRIINPGPVVLVSASHGDASTIATVAWHMPVSSWPKLIALALAAKRYTLELVEASGCFCVNLPDYSLLERVVFCGTYSGRDIDKFRETGFTPVPCGKIPTLGIGECVAHIECRLNDVLTAGDHRIVVGEVVAAGAEENLFNRDGVIDITRVRLIHHLGGSHFGVLGKG